MAQLGDPADIYFQDRVLSYTITKVLPDRYYIAPRDRFDYESEIVKIGNEWKVARLNQPHTVQITPLQLKTPGQYTRQIISTGKDRLRSPLGGMTREQLLASQLVFLQHITFDPEHVIASWKLDSRLNISREGRPVHVGLAGAYMEEWMMETSAYNQKQFPGIYTSPVSQVDLLSKEMEFSTLPSNWVQLVLPLSLLEQRNWHLNAKDEYGNINNMTFSPATLPTFLPKLNQLYGIHESKKGEVWTPEVVFHDPISLDFAQAIIVKTHEMKERIERLLQGRPQIPVLISSKDLYKRMAGMQFFKGEDRLDPSPPQYCYTGVEGESIEERVSADDVVTFQTENPYTMVNFYSRTTRPQLDQENNYIWQKRLDLCGIPEEYSPDRKEELFRRIEDRMQDLYYNNVPRTPVTPEDQPPWKYTPEYYREQYRRK